MASPLHPQLTRRWSWGHPVGVAGSNRERLAIAMSVGAMGTLGFSVTAPLLPDLATAFGVSRGSIGWVQAAVSIAGVLLSAVIGYLADRLGRRRVVLTSLVLFTVFGCAGFLTRTFEGLIAMRVLQGIGTSGLLGLGIVMVSDLFEGPARTRAMGFNLTAVTTVGMLGPLASGFIAGGGVFRPFLIFLIGVPLLVWASRLPSDPTKNVESPIRHAGAAFAALRQGGQIGDFGGILLVTFAATVLQHGFGFTNTPLFLDSEFGVGPAGRGVIIAMFQFGTVLAAVQIGRLRARASGSRLVGAGFVLTALGMAVAALAPDPWAVAVGLGLTGVGFGLFVPLAQDRAATMGGALFRGLTVLTWVTIVRSAQVVGPPTASFFNESIGARATFGIAAAVMAIAAVTWRPARRRIRHLGSPAT
ncbi:MAG TPA: MFS transporter [Acidimicrobiia bacterium]|nr:MFS transporter [Acidimicrobiia bacterium]